MAKNRVTPFGSIEDLPGRGTLMGNRGVLGGNRRWATKAWITCALEYKGWRAADSKYTPLFFLDEASAFAAGHRPCALCRRADHNRFRAAWGDERLPQIDAALHRERTGSRPLVGRDDLTDGAMVAIDDRAHIFVDDSLRPWSMTGYGDATDVPDQVTLLTPPSLLGVLWRGYEVAVHESAGSR